MSYGNQWDPGDPPYADELSDDLSVRFEDDLDEYDNFEEDFYDDYDDGDEPWDEDFSELP